VKHNYNVSPVLYIGETNTVPPLGEGKLTLGTNLADFFMLGAPLQRCKMVRPTIILVGYKGKCDVSSTYLNQ
jgi:hypothetical protein